jgi:thymidylate synthase (FAD)
VLPMATMTEWDWSGSLYFWAKIYMLRKGHGAQSNAQDAAAAIADVVKPLFPVSWAALTTGRAVCDY